MAEKIIRGLNIFLSAAGVLVFGGLLLFVTLDKEGYQRQVETFVMAEVERRIDQTIDPGFTEGLIQATGILSERLRKQAEAMEAQLRGGIHDFVNAVIENYCDEDCLGRCEGACVERQTLETALTVIYEKSLNWTKIGIERLRQRVEDKYASTHAELRADVLIFLSSSLAVMLTALMLALFKGQASRHLLPISFILMLSTLFVASWYLFGQNWLLVVIYSDYWGWGYLTTLGWLFLWQCDIVFNRARITREVIYFFVGIAGSFGVLADRPHSRS